MITITKNLIWKLVFYFVLLAVALFLVKGVLAQQTPEDIAKTYGVTFPITDLSNCQNYSECRDFCEDPVNSETCVSYGKSKGFYQDDPVIADRDKIINEAKTRLGCDSYEACLNFCEVPVNFDACNSFAKSQGIVGGVIDDPGREEIISKAKEVLGCDSGNSCQAFCLQQDNISKCKSFAEEVGMRGGERQIGPGGCSSEGTCRSFCSDPNNFQVCSGFQEVTGGTFTGPGGCSDPASCFDYCRQNPKDCGYKDELDEVGTIPPRYDPTEMCNRTPNCSWSGSSCQCGFYGETKETAQKAAEYAGFCASNPDKCRPGAPGEMFGGREQRQEFEDFCKNNPDKCRQSVDQTSPGRGAPDPAAECGRYGCSWTNNSCQCTSESINRGTDDKAPDRYPAPSYEPGRSDSSEDYCARNPDKCRGPQTPGYPQQRPPESYPGGPTDRNYPQGNPQQPQPYQYTQPSQPSQQSQPSEPSQPSQPSQPSEPSQPSQPSGDSGGGGGGGGGGGAPADGSGGGGSMPSSGSYTPPGGMTQGISTTRGLLQQLLDFLQGK